MRIIKTIPAALALLLALVPSPASAQAAKNVTLHVSSRWKECSFQLDPALTQAAWRRFTREAGIVAYFRPLTDARPMGAGNFEFAGLQASTPIDDESSAWNDTFVHPSADHWLTEGNNLSFPGLMVRAGVSERIDVGAYFTKNPNANYGFYGAQLQYALVNDVEHEWAVAARTSFISLFGPEDLDHTVFGADLVTSTRLTVHPRWLVVSPYAGVSGYLATSHEKSAVVDLRNETVTGAQAMLGAVAQVSWLRIAAEVNTASVNARSIKVGVSF